MYRDTRKLWTDEDLEAIARRAEATAGALMDEGPKSYRQAKEWILRHLAVRLFKRARSYGLEQEQAGPTHQHIATNELWRYDGPAFIYRGDYLESHVDIRPKLHLFVHLDSGVTYIMSEGAQANTLRPLNAAQS
jgi:hypothetical protein